MVSSLYFSDRHDDETSSAILTALQPTSTSIESIESRHVIGLTVKLVDLLARYENTLRGIQFEDFGLMDPQSIWEGFVLHLRPLSKLQRIDANDLYETCDEIAVSCLRYSGGCTPSTLEQGEHTVASGLTQD